MNYGNSSKEYASSIESVARNSIKMYDKQKSVLRIEMTMNDPRAFKACREMIRNGRPQLDWLPMRKGLADIARRVEVSRAANQRYLEGAGSRR